MSFTFVASVLLKLVYRIFKEKKPTSNRLLEARRPRFFQATHLDQAQFYTGNTRNLAQAIDEDDDDDNEEEEDEDDDNEEEEEQDQDSEGDLDGDPIEQLERDFAELDPETDTNQSFRSSSQIEQVDFELPSETDIDCDGSVQIQEQASRNVVASQRSKSVAIVEASSLFALPARILIQFLHKSLSLIFSFLDSIEGIEPSEGKQTSSRLRLDWQQDSSSRTSKKSNYFHRRYLSRRSLSAALLDESDEQSSTSEEDSRSDLFEGPQICIPSGFDLPRYSIRQVGVAAR